MQSLKRTVITTGRALSRFVHPARIYGPLYGATLKRLRDLRVPSAAQLESFEREKLKGLFRAISGHVPFYSELFPAGWEKRDMKELLLELPPITKEMMQADAERFTLTSLPSRRRVYLTTGGSTAQPLGFYDARRSSAAIEYAHIHYLWSQTGYTPTSRSAVFRGSVVSAAGENESAKRLWFYDPFRRSLVFSSYHLQGADLEKIYHRLLRFDPPFIQAYPSAANVLANFIEENGRRPPESLKALLLGSETLPGWQRRRIERAFRAPVYSWYGLAEKAALAGERLGDPRLHVLPSYGYVYLRGENGQVITEAETPGEIIATGFTNQATQFVNYHTGDIGLWSSAGTGRLGAFLTRILERVEGRAQELALSAGGRKISMCAINMHSDIFDRIRQFRFVQRRRGEILMQIIRKPGYGAEDENEIISGMTEKFGADMKLDIEYIDRLPRAQSGKARFLVQHLDLTEA